MKPIIAQDQVRLGPARCMALAITGMAYRMFRSMITVVILALAVAFLVHMIGYGLIANDTQVNAYEELRASRALGEWVSRLNTPTPEVVILGDLAAGREPRLGEYTTWGRVGAVELEQAQQVARRILQVERYLGQLQPAARASIVGDLTPQQVIARLADPQHFQTFMDRVRDFGLPMPLGDAAAFTELIREDRPVLVDLIERIRAGQRQAITRVRQATAGVALRQLFAEPPADFAQTLAAAGYAIDEEQLEELTTQAQQGQDTEALVQALTSTQLRGSLARQMNTDVQSVNLASVQMWMTSRSRAETFANALGEHGGPAMDAERLLELANLFRRHQKLQVAAGPEAPADEDSLFGLPVRTQWLIGLSFMVCVVGVANAMLMSVTERFTEIATMKCLGAMDRFVMMMFVFEAVIQGLVGGLVGMALGFLLALLRGLIEYGGMIFEPSGTWGRVMISSVGSVAVGMILAAVAAVGPSWVAARLAPMEAMRVE